MQKEKSNIRKERGVKGTSMEKNKGYSKGKEGARKKKPGQNQVRD